MATTTAAWVREKQIAVVREALDGGYLRIYSGQQPASTESKPRGTLLAELRFGSPAFEKADGAKIKAHGITREADAPATGDAEWYRCSSEDGTAVWDGDVSRKGGGGSLELDTVEIQKGAEVTVTALTYTQP